MLRFARPDRKKKAVCRCVLICLLAGIVSGCAVTQDYQRPEVDMPNRWRIDYQTASNIADTVWWENFQDPDLNELIETALKENKDLRIATARVEEFSARVKTVRSGFYPQIGYGGSADREDRSLETDMVIPGSDPAGSTYRTSLNISWELDIWGRIKRAEEAAQADLLAAEEGRQAVILSLVSAVAIGYFDLVSLDRQLDISKQTQASRKEWLQLFEKKLQGGQISNLELAQVRSAYERSATYIPILERQIALQENALSVLIGRGPGKIARNKKMDFTIMPEIPRGIPSDLLTRRPDIRQSEQNLIAANAMIGVIRTQYFPSISLTGLFGYASASLSDLLQNSAKLWNMAAGAAGPVFTGGRIEGEIRQAEAKRQQLIYDYLKKIQTALREVNDSLINIKKLRELQEVEIRLIDALKEYVYFAHSRYDAGFSTYLAVMDSEKSLYEAQIQQVETARHVFAAIVDNYKAMGGGWVTEGEGNPAGEPESTVPQ
jgi:multidrug efflux system outer membrane protein